MVNKEMKFLDNGDIRYEVVDKAARSNIQTINTVLDTKADTSNVTALDTRVTAVEGDVSDLKEEINSVNAKTHGVYNLVIEKGNINLSGADVDSTTRARTKYAFNNSFILTLTSGFKVLNIFHYDYDANNNLVLDTYTTFNQPTVVFMTGKWISSTASAGISNDAYRISISKTDKSETITDEEIANIVSSYVEVNTNGIVKLTGMGTSGSDAGAVNIGDIYYNTSTKLLRIKTDLSGGFYTVPYADNTIYTIDGHEYLWNGSDLVRTDSDAVANIETLQSETTSIKSNLDDVNNSFIESTSLTFVQGGISLNGQDDDSQTATRIRTGYLNIYSYFDFSVSSQYEARIAMYDKGGNFVSLSDYGNSYSNINGKDYLIRLLVRHTDNSNILVSEMVLGLTYEFNLRKELNSDVLPIDYFTPLTGSSSLYTSNALEHTEIDSKTSAELFQEYDAMVTQYPQFFKRESDIGNDAYGTPIRAYTLRFQYASVYEGESGSTNVWDDSYNYKTILITSGVHGGEKSASWGLMLAIKEILSSSDVWALFIKSNFVLKIIPCVNIWGFDNNSRLNYKDVNVNRDAYTWESEEGQALKTWYDSNLNAIYYMDVHGTNGGRGYQEIWNLSPYKTIHCQNCAKIGASLYGNWVSKFGRYPTFPAIISSFNGLLVSYLEAQNIPSSIVEIPRDITSGGTENYLDSCAFAKDVIINLIQACGQTAFKAFPIVIS